MPARKLELSCFAISWTTWRNTRADPRSGYRALGRQTGGDSLPKLLHREEVVADPALATEELRGALAKLADTVAVQRLKVLEEKSRWARLGPEELKEFQQLISRKVRA